MKAELLFAGVIVIWTSAAACAQQQSTVTAQASTETLRFIPQADLRIIDPVWTSASVTRNHGYMVYDTLFAVDQTFTPQPQMVQAWTVSDDKLTYTFALRDGLKFHDGQPVRSLDCVASLERWSKRDVLGQKLAERLGEFKIIDDRSFAILLKRPFPLLLAALARGSGGVPFIMPERIARTDAYTQIKDATGSGPFKFVKEEWAPGHRVVYVKNADYVPRTEPSSWASGGKVARVDRVEWIYIPDTTTAMAALTAGEADWWENPPLDVLPVLERTRGITVDRLYPVASIVIMRFNQLHPPFDNPKLRRALLYAVDQREYMSAVGGNEKYWRPCLSFYPCDTAMASEVGAEPLKGPRDLELAKRLIKESGYQGEKIVLLAPTDFPVVNAISLVTEDLLRRIGLNVELAASDWGTLISRRASKEAADKGGWNIFLTILGGADNLDPAESNSLRGNGADAWFGWPTDPIVERLRDDWIDAPDEAERKQIAADVQRQLFHSVPHIPIGDYFVTTAFRENLEGVNLGPSLYMWNVVKR